MSSQPSTTPLRSLRTRLPELVERLLNAAEEELEGVRAPRGGVAVIMKESG